MSSTTHNIEEMMQMAEYLTMKNIITEAGPRMLPATAKRHRSDLLAAIRASLALQEVVREAFIHKRQQQLDERDSRLKRARVETNISDETAEEDSFLEDPDEFVKQQALARFIDRTNNRSTHQASCLSCAQENFVDEMTHVFLDKLPNSYLLTPIFRHPAQKLTFGMLLYEPAITFSEDKLGGGICTDCLEDLRDSNIPLFSLVNGLWIGTVPNELAILNLPERLLIGLYFPAVYVVKLYPQRKGANHWDTTALNSGVRGNVSTYQLNTPDITAMIEGNLLPHRPALLATTIGITIIGPKNLPVKSLPQFLHSSEQHLLEEEHESYIIEDDSNIDATFETFDSPTDATDISEDVLSNPSVVPMQAHGVIDAEGSELSNQDILANTLANTSRTHDKNYAVQHGGKFINEYARVNTRAFPCLFPYGLGGFEVQRPRTISYEAQARWSMRYADRRFRKDFHFMFQVFGVIQKRQKTSLLLVERKPKDNIYLIPSSILLKNTSPPINIRAYIWGMTMMKNPPSLWITINPADTHDPIAQVLAGEEIDLDAFDKTAGPDASHRALIIANDPYIAANFFHTTIRAIIEELMGIIVHKPK
ncbi:hypothetical protein BD769DRAFT_1675703 [Suillus cothurnatus]|nr:hypothetical protein BD769DRAFT_1675703 [Suillus cothurnatus]